MIKKSIGILIVILCITSAGLTAIEIEQNMGETQERMSRTTSFTSLPGGIIFVFGSDVDVKLVQLPPGEDYVDLEVLNKPFYLLFGQGITVINPGAFLRLYEAKGFFSPHSRVCIGICTDWGLIG